MHRFAAAAALAVAAAALAGPAAAATYYVSPTGSDAAAGTAATSAWRTVARVNAASLAPGDTVRFEGGQTFTGLLQPPASGSAGAPIVFTSYGAGRPNLRDGVSLASRTWLTLRNLRVDTGDWRTAGTTRGVTTASSGTGVQQVVIEDCEFANVALGLLIQNRLDRFWTVRRTTIRQTRDSGILIYDPTRADEVGGSDMLFEDNELLDNGIDASIAYKKHAVYGIGTDIVWRNNVVRRFSEGAFSLRARGNTLEGNTISDGPYAIYFSAYDSAPGTTRIAYNTISNVTGAAIELNSAGRTANVESFVIANNTILPSGSAPGIRVIGTSGSVSVANNVVVAATGYGFRVDKVPGGGLVERNNLWHRTGSGASWAWLGSVHSTLAAYRSASGQGAGDLAADPLLDALHAPLAGSPAVDAGTTAVSTLTYSGACAGRLYDYCGATVDLGAVERGAPVPAPEPPAPAPAPTPPPPAPAPDTTAPALTITSPTNGQTVPLSFVITASASDASGIKSVTFWFDGKAPCVDTTAPYVSCTIRTKTGGHTIRVRATDTAGNYTESVIKVWAQKGAPALRATQSLKAKPKPLRQRRP